MVIERKRTWLVEPVDVELLVMTVDVELMPVTLIYSLLKLTVPGLAETSSLALYIMLDVWSHSMVTDDMVFDELTVAVLPG